MRLLVQKRLYTSSPTNAAVVVNAAYVAPATAPAMAGALHACRQHLKPKFVSLFHQDQCTVLQRYLANCICLAEKNLVDGLFDCPRLQFQRQMTMQVKVSVAAIAWLDVYNNSGIQYTFMSGRLHKIAPCCRGRRHLGASPVHPQRDGVAWNWVLSQQDRDAVLI